MKAASAVREDRPFGAVGQSAGLYLTEVSAYLKCFAASQQKYSGTLGIPVGPWALLASDGWKGKQGGRCMNTTWTRQYVLGSLEGSGTVFHHGLALIGVVAILLVSFAQRPVLRRAPGSLRDDRAIPYDGAVSLFEGAERRTPRSTRPGPVMCRAGTASRPTSTEVFVGAAHEAGREVGLDPLLILA